MLDEIATIVQQRQQFVISLAITVSAYQGSRCCDTFLRCSPPTMYSCTRNTDPLSSAACSAPQVSNVPRCAQTFIVCGNSFIWLPAGWSSVDGFYYTMITYLTVGLGDFVWPMQNSQSLYGKVIPVSLGVTSGIGLVAMVLSSSQVVLDEFRSIHRHYFPRLRSSVEETFIGSSERHNRTQPPVERATSSRESGPPPASAGIRSSGTDLHAAASDRNCGECAVSSVELDVRSREG